MSIPASAIVSVNPSVLSAGGQALDLSGLVLTTNTRVPIGSVVSFASALDVSNYFGASALEALGAAVYFSGFDGSNVKPAVLLFSQYPTAAVAAYLRGASLASMTLAALKLLTGTITITANGVTTTSATINLTAATSFSNAAAIIQAAFASPSFTVSYDSVSGAFVFTVNTTGPTSTITYASSTLAVSLALTQATGAVTSQGSAATDPVTAMNAIIAQTTNFASFMTAFDPDVTPGVNTNALLFAQWTSQQNNRYAYVAWDTDASPTVSAPATSSLGYLLQQGNYSGTIPVYEPTDLYLAWFICGSIASIDFTETQGRATLAYKSQSGIAPSVTGQTAAANLEANGYNYYGGWAVAVNNFIGIRNGVISGKYKWIDSYVNQIWLNNQLQLALMTLLFSVKSIPYNTAGYALIEAACMDPINAGLNFGAFQPGVQLSTLQAAEVNSAAGANISTTLQNRGWYFQVLPASAQSRGNRTTPPINFWYMDGGSVQQINLASIEIQ